MLTFDIDNLTKAISDDASCGVDVREDAKAQALYVELKQLRQQCRRDEREASLSEDETHQPIDWSKLIAPATTLLTEHTKDLEVASWLVEAWVRESGFDGFIAGCEVLTQLTATFGEQLYPRPDEDGLDTTVAGIAALSGDYAPGTIVQPLNLATLFSAHGHDISLWDIQQAAEEAEAGLTQQEIHDYAQSIALADIDVIEN